MPPSSRYGRRESEPADFVNGLLTHMASAPEGATLAKLWVRYQTLSPTEKLVMRLKALIGSWTNKTAFVSAMVATHSRAADGKAWTVAPSLSAAW